MNRLTRRRRARHEKGAVTIMAAILITCLLGFAALVIDLGNLMMVRNQLQNAADAAALAGAACLYPRSACSNTALTGVTWTSANSQASAWINQNKAQKGALGDQALATGTVTTGYWDVTHKNPGLLGTGITPTSTEYPAVQVTISKSGSSNGGAVVGFFSNVLGIASTPVSATAVAAVSNPGYTGSGAVFPMAVTGCLYSTYWNANTGQPNIDPSTGQPYVFDSADPYPNSSSCYAGQWTSFLTDANDATTINNLISNGNPSSLSDGTNIWIEPGTKASLYQTVNACSAAGNGTCQWEIVPVVASVTTHATQAVVGFACVEILSASWTGSTKYIRFQMAANADRCEAGGGGGSGGTGVGYGAYLPPRIVN